MQRSSTYLLQLAGVATEPTVFARSEKKLFQTRFIGESNLKDQNTRYYSLWNKSEWFKP